MRTRVGAALVAGLAGLSGFLIAALAGDPPFGLVVVAVVAIATAGGAIGPRLVRSNGGDTAAGPVGSWADFRRELKRSRRHGRRFALVRIPAGMMAADRGPDRMIVAAEEVAAGLWRQLRAVDRSWTDGPDVFVLLPESDRRSAQAFVARIVAAVPALASLEPGYGIFPEDGMTSGAILAAVQDRPVSTSPIPLPTAGFEQPGTSAAGGYVLKPSHRMAASAVSRPSALAGSTRTFAEGDGLGSGD